MLWITTSKQSQSDPKCPSPPGVKETTKFSSTLFRNYPIALSRWLMSSVCFLECLVRLKHHAGTSQNFCLFLHVQRYWLLQRLPMRNLYFYVSVNNQYFCLKNTDDVHILNQVTQFELHLIFFQMLRDDLDFNWICWKSKNTDSDFSTTILKGWFFCDKICKNIAIPFWFSDEVSIYWCSYSVIQFTQK